MVSGSNEALSARQPTITRASRTGRDPPAGTAAYTCATPATAGSGTMVSQPCRSEIRPCTVSR